MGTLHSAEVNHADVYTDRQPTPEFLTEFAETLKPVANSKPRLNVVPLLPSASWTPGGFSGVVSPLRLHQSLAAQGRVSSGLTGCHRACGKLDGFARRDLR
jgi:hypothetical protein